MINNALSYMIKYFKNDVKRINHAIKVYGFADTISIAENVSGVKKSIIEMSAILHDIGIKEAERKYQSSAGSYQEIEGPPIAENIMKDLRVSNEIIDRVCYIIGNHHSYHKIDDIDFQILVEADFIVNIFEDNISKESIESISKKIFRTNSGKEILNTMYPAD